MPRVISEQYIVSESPSSVVSSGTSDIQSIIPANKSIGVWLGCEVTDARVTFDGTAPGAGVGPGVLIPFGAPPQFFPFPFGPGQGIKFASNGSTACTMTVIFVQ